MALVTRDLLPFPLGDNSSDTLINGIHFNVTTLKNWNYTYYSNQTISNSSSKCLLMFDKYIPTALYENGTFINSVSCFEPILGHGIRSIVGMTCGLLCAVSFILTFRNFAKHGELHLKAEQQQRWNPISRKFKWYWMFAVSIFGTIGGLTAMDIDRYYLPQIPIMISNIFWFFMILATLAAVWESVRHWGSWQERQMIDPDPFLLLENRNDFRSKVRLYLPLVFYAFLLTSLFLVCPRSWTAIQLQRDPEQTLQYARPLATDIRFKISALFMFFSWMTIIFSLCHSIKHYTPRKHTLVKRLMNLVRSTPIKFHLTLPLSLAMVGYAAASSCVFDISPLKVTTNLGLLYGLGWAPVLCIISVYNIFGHMEQNEDLEIIRQRLARGADIDGLSKNPDWWKRFKFDNKKNSSNDQLAQNAGEMGSDGTTNENTESIELQNLSASGRQHSNGVASTVWRRSPAYNNDRRASAQSGLSQKIHSMLDI